MPSGTAATPLRRHQVFRLLCAFSLALNVALLTSGGIHVSQQGGLQYLKQKLGWARHEFQARAFQLSRLDFFRQLPRGDADIVFAGDSHVAATPYAEVFSPIRNQGIGGDTTAGLLLRLDEITGRRPDCVFLLIGSNDVVRRVPVEEIVHNYRRILNRIGRESPATRVFIQSIPPTNHSIHRAAVDRNPIIRAVNQALGALALAEGVTFIDLTPVLADADGNLRMEFAAEDGLHLNLAGQLAMCEALRPYLTPLAATPGPQDAAADPLSRKHASSSDVPHPSPTPLTLHGSL